MCYLKKVYRVMEGIVNDLVVIHTGVFFAHPLLI